MISIIIPAYNAEKKIRQTVYSVLNQTSSDYELIVIDDGSTDRTLDILTELSITNSQLIVIHTENHGSGPARNIGIDHSNGEWLYFPDSDDELDVNTVKFLTEITQGSNYDTVVFGYKLAKGNRIIREKTYKDIVIDGSDMRKNYVPFYSMNAEYGIQGAPWNKLFSSELVKKNGVYFPPLRRHQDDGFISLYMQFASKICFSSKVLYTYNENSIDDILRKYPIDYYASVEGLFDLRYKTIIKWNPNNHEVKQIVDDEYICNLVRSFEVLLSPKCKWRYKQKKEWINQYSERIRWSFLSLINTKKRLYQGTVVKLLKKKSPLLLPFIWVKVHIQLFKIKYIKS